MNTISKIKLTEGPDLNHLYQESLELLSALIAIPSISGDEMLTADQIESFLNLQGINTFRKYNNIWCYNKHLDASKPTILLNSHHDTVKPNEQYTRDPFSPIIEDEKIYGLGSNDAGGPLVALTATFLYFYERKDLPFNLCLAATAEEETSGELGIRSILPDIKEISFAIVGEPTGMHMAIAEKGSMVIDCVSKGRSGHAAREEGDNAIYHALKDIDWFKNYLFPIMDDQPQPVKMTVTEIKAGIQHNIVPAECSFTVDIRFDHNYTEREIMNTIINHTSCHFTLRPNVLKPSFIDMLHPVVISGLSLGRKTYLSPTSSDQGWLDMPSVKMGPGNSARSHTADEFIGIEEIEEGIDIYISLLETLKLS
ncbi:acetylornithine deacetylase [Pedobacter ginsenosidimutans]|uniref:Acetylornithine deacetylase n=1 Tax=Pedobacter ginsenosidimutans TaxID=687842 RepID=A0A0T5VVY6_9SPHI|nr:M20/M25/M40 family metallo-hydrolase [Pedobacter ginsenosidimutans]KRT18011.1 acetylornithine deacetylase [Pedobacter ginsenosidimutans]